MDKTRLAVAAVVAFVVFFFVLIWGTALGAAGLHWLVQRFLGEKPLPIVLPVFVLFLVLASVVARRLFRWIIGVRKGLGELHDGQGTAEEEK